MFHNSTNVMITGGHLTEVNYHGRSAMELLQAATAPGAFHNSLERFDPPKCHPHTREAVRKKILDWVTKKIDTDAFVLWLYGAAGAGKSAIAQTIAEVCHELKLLLASFFFSRSAPLRCISKPFFSSIAYQMVKAIPATRGFVESAIERDPLIFQQSLEDQYLALVVHPLLSLLETGVDEQVPFPPLIIIDGLDECTDGTRHEIVNIILRLGRRFRLPIIFLLASRSEQDISLAMTPAKTGTDITRIALDTEYESNDDIERYLRDKLSEIRDTHPLRFTLPRTWPSNEHIHTLVWKSSGQFIYASTSVKYISSRRHRPTRRLDVVIGVVPPGPSDLPFAELDALYRFIIYSAEDVQLTVRLLITIVVFGPSFSTMLDLILSLEPGDAVLHLADLGSLVSAEEYDDGDSSFSVLHASLYDFLTDPACSGTLYVDPGLIHADIARGYLHILQEAYHLESIGAALIPFSTYDFPNHFSKAALTPELMAEILGFRLCEMLPSFGWWLFATTSTRLTRAIMNLKDFAQSTEIVLRYQADFDKTAMSFLAAYPTGSVVIWATLNISYGKYSSAHSPVFWSHHCPESVRWRTFAAIFTPALDTITHTSYPLWNDKSMWQSGIWEIGCWDIDACFFRDASRSNHYAVNDDHINAVSAQCLFFLINQTFPLYLPSLCSISKLKTRPWFTRQQKRISGRGTPRMKTKLPIEIGSEETPTPSVQLLLSLHFAFIYLPALLHSASYSPELIESAKSWWSKRYLHLLFPDETARTGKAIGDYLLRVGGNNGGSEDSECGQDVTVPANV